MRNLWKVCVALAVAALLANQGLAQPRPGFGFGGGQLLTNESVQKELKLTDEQKTKAKELGEVMGKKMQEAFGKLQDLKPEERREKMQEMFKEIGEETNKKTAAILNKDQLKRFKQIQTQQMGWHAFGAPEVQKALNLTDEQKKSIKETTEAVGKKIQEEIKDLEGAERFTKMRELGQKLGKEAEAKINGKLTAEQKKTWKELIGEPFEVKFERPRPPGRTPQADK